MKLHTLIAASTAAAALAVPPLTMAADSYPEKPIEFIVPWGPGGGSDLLMRIVGQHLEETLDEAVPIINMPGASGTIGLREATRRDNDGYTITQIHEGLLIAHHSGVTDLNWDDFEVISMMTSINSVIAVNADTGWETLDDLLEDVSASPGEYRMGVTMGGIPTYGRCSSRRPPVPSSATSATRGPVSGCAPWQVAILPSPSRITRPPAPSWKTAT